MDCLNCKKELTDLDYKLLRAEYVRHGVENPDEFLQGGFLCDCCNSVGKAENNRIDSLERYI